MNVAVCGLGKVGKPLLDALRYKGFNSWGYDCDPVKFGSSLYDVVLNSNACIFIVPTPSKPDGSFSNEYLMNALTSFSKEVRAQKKSGSYLYIVTSTTVPGSCDKFKEITGENICYKPEFIRLAQVRDDLLSPSFVLIGEGCREAGDHCEAIYRKFVDAPVKRMSLIEAELAKITLNCALTMKISLANQLHLVAKKLGADSSKIMDAVGTDPRINNRYLEPGWPFSGPCLPRDNRMFQYVAKQVGVDACLSAAVDRINESL